MKKEQRARVIVNGKKFGVWIYKRGDSITKTTYDNDFPVIEKKYLSGELVSIKYFLKKIKKPLDK